MYFFTYKLSGDLYIVILVTHELQRTRHNNLFRKISAHILVGKHIRTWLACKIKTEMGETKVVISFNCSMISFQILTTFSVKHA
jgi:hypothetical protein